MEEMLTIVNPEDETVEAQTCFEAEEESVCNSEGTETVTFFEGEEDLIDWEDVPSVETKREMLTRKCREAKEACQSTASRLVKDWKETNGNPYIKQTCITQVDIYRNPDDAEPIDSFRTEHVKGYSARSLAVLGAAAMVVACTVDCIMKKVLK